MEIFHCKCCNYSTKKVSHFKKHLNTEKHILNYKDSNEDLSEKFKKKIFCCLQCNAEFFSKTTLWRHNQTCNLNPEVENLKIENKELKQELKNKDNQLNNKDNQLPLISTFSARLFDFAFRCSRHSNSP